MSNVAQLALEGGDPRDPHHPVLGNADPVESRLLHSSHDPNVSFEEYMYYASITRVEEKEANARHVSIQGPKTFKSVVMNRFSKGHHDSVAVDSPADSGSANGEKTASDEKSAAPATRNLGNVSDADWKNASRAVRTAGWSGVFYLITVCQTPDNSEARSC